MLPGRHIAYRRGVRSRALSLGHDPERKVAHGMREHGCAMTARLEVTQEFERPEARPHHRGLLRVARWAALVAVIASLAFLVVWHEGAEGRAIRDMPTPERRALFDRTLQSLQRVCSPPVEAMRDYCGEQAWFALQFPECDHACEALAVRQISRVQIPR
jgi:hypothetical protein